MNATIRKATLTDLPFIKYCLVDSWLEHAKNEADLLSEKHLAEFETEQFYRDSITNNKGHLLIAEVSGERAGLISAYEQKLGYFFHHTLCMYIDDVYVVKKFRRSGIARALLDEIEKIASKQGIKRIDNRVYSYNQPMQKLLKSMRYSSPYATWVKVIQ
jgi:ribosomal protein S18 acetylase RimI-like enzyme